ncbi:enolase-phosphatase E1 [Danaus plexippus]|uniref:enolase-phosphatase E1 n=1 Tax=Danaus plexippus TaxID=13037 RepID=UPI002AB2F2B2|nr:enolase-phosphatase E1 [Danaus plexippus]
MANDNKDIGEIVKKCKILLLDIEGTTTSISFVKDKLFPYAEENVKQFLEAQWENDDVKESVTALRKLAIEDKEKNVEGLVAIPGEDASKEDQIEGLVNNVKWQMSADRKVGALKQLQGLIWKQGYDKGDLKGHVFDDVSTALEQWHSIEGQKVYIYSSGSVQAQKLLFGQSLAGDLLKYIDGHFDTAVGGKQEESSYKAIVEKIGCNAEEVLFVTDIVKEAEAASKAGLHVALASREGNSSLPSEATDTYPVIHTFTQLAVSNKRKTEPQDEQPAKVPKTDIQKDVKSASETDSSKEETPLPEKAEEPEKMEVEESKDEPVKEEEKVKTEISIEDVTNTKEVTENVVDMEPVVQEVEENKPEKTEDMETETSDDKVDDKNDEVKAEKEKEKDTPVENNVSTESKEKTEVTPDVPKESSDKNGIETNASASEASPTVITEIEEVTSDKENISEMAEIIEDLEPVVEEPAAAEDVEELRNVGDVLEKECDEILSKVQGVTNLETMPLRPLLNPIEEESMEAENTNDIMDSILDTEQEMEMKNSEATAKEKHPEKNIDDKEKEKVEKNGVLEETVTESDVKIEITPEESADKSEAEENIGDKKDKNDKTEEKNSEPSKETDKTVKDKPTEDAQVNGKTNGDLIENGDSNKMEELSARLTENGDDVRSNGDTKNGDGEKVEPEVSDIKVKTVSTEEPRTELIEQATEA